jgi:hypothetical protein
VTSRQEVIRSSFMAAYGGKDESGILARDYGVFRNLEPWVKDMEENDPDHGNLEYRAHIERLVSQFREWRSKPRRKEKDFYK